MQIRQFEPGDEAIQAEIFNQSASRLPAFKPASAEEIARRYQAPGSDPTSRFYAVRDGRVVGYAVFNPNGRISVPWCLPDAPDAREELLETMFDAMRQRGFTEAWAAYRGDWAEVLETLESHGFAQSREMINYLADAAALPSATSAAAGRIRDADPNDWNALPAVPRGVLATEDPEVLGRFFWENAYFPSSAVFTLLDDDNRPRGLGLTITNQAFAHPTKLDPAMPCFRLGAFGTETERHKRVDGMVSVLFEATADGESLLAEAVRRLRASRHTHAAAQAPSDQAALCRFYDTWFQRQGSFPILARRLGTP